MSLPTSIRVYVSKADINKTKKLGDDNYDDTTCPIANRLRRRFPGYKPSVGGDGSVKLTSKRGVVYSYRLSEDGVNKVDNFDTFKNMHPGHVRLSRVKN